MHGTNDAAVITGTSTAGADGDQLRRRRTGGTLNATDVDSSSDLCGADRRGRQQRLWQVLDRRGGSPGPTRWTAPTTSSLAASDYTDSFTVATADGTEQVITVTMHGTNDAAVITGTATAELTETNAAQSTGGNLNATDVDSSDDLRGADRRGRQQRLRQVLDRCGRHLDLHDEQRPRRVRGRPSTTPTASRWRRPTAPTQVITVTMHGTNDAAVITGSSTAELTETNAAQSTGGDLNATDVDSSATFVAQSDVAGSNGYGKFSIDAAGTWTYTMNSAHDEFVAGQSTTPTASRWRRPTALTQVITVTMHGTNDAAVITGSSTAALTETNAAQSTGGDLNATDVDSPATFVAQSNVAGSNGYGKFSIDAAGAWTYTMNNAHDEFVGGTRLHRQHHGGDGRRHARRSSPSPCTAPTTRR